MTQSEINAKAMADIFALEDSKDLFEAIGDINDDQGMGLGDETEYGPDQMLTVIPGSTDSFNGQAVTPAKEPSDEDKRFVIDSFAEKMTNAHKTVVDDESIDGFAPLIQKEVGMNINVHQFLTDMKNSANQRLSAQNVSEAQPSGAAPEEPIAAADEGAAGAMDPMAAADPMGTPEMTPAPGGIAPEPSLDANVGDDGLGLDGITDDGLGGMDAEPEPAGDDGLGLDGITDDGLGGEGDLGGEPAAEDDLGLGGEGELGLDGESAPEGEPAPEGELPPEDEPAPEDNPAPEGEDGDDVLGGSNLDNLSDDTFGSEDEGEDKENPIPDTDEDADFEAEMTSKKAQLESIYSNYIEERARTKIRNMVESYMATKKATEKKPQVESVTEEPKSAEPQVESVKEEPKSAEPQFEAAAEAKREELGAKVAGIVESSKEESRAATMLEAAKRAFVKVENAKKDEELDSMLESISANYHKVQAEKKAAGKLQAKLESIANKYAPKAPEQKPMTESVQTKKTSLNAQLQEIIDSL